MRKYDFISALAQETATEVVKNRDEWMKYLTTAARRRNRKVYATKDKGKRRNYISSNGGSQTAAPGLREYNMVGEKA